MADWVKPDITDLYTDVLTFIKARDVDAITLVGGTATSLPIGAIKYDRIGRKFQEWNGTAWIDIVLAVSGGGTGGTTPGGGGLGLGTMSVQNANTVNISGGVISGITSFNLSSDIAFNADGTRNIGSNGTRPNQIFVRNGLVIPVGADKWVTF
jgi:hypothetical protein